MDRIAFFITPHGFGHAARACAVMESWGQRRLELGFEIYSSVPEWFFTESLKVPFKWHNLRCDIGLKQLDPFTQDLKGTVRDLRELYPLRTGLISKLADQVRASRSMAIVSDIAPIGIAVAQQAGLPSILVENFTWDWIYHEYHQQQPELAPFTKYLSDLFSEATLHIQTAPICNRNPKAVLTTPVSRQPRLERSSIREQLKLGDDQTVILITMGGVKIAYEFTDQLSSLPDYQFIVLGSLKSEHRYGNVLVLPESSDYYHPDLINAADLVVAKLGYSTIAEVLSCNIPLLFVARDGFREAEILRHFALSEMSASELDQISFRSGDWLKKLPEIISPEMKPKRKTNAQPRGAEQVVTAIEQIL